MGGIALSPSLRGSRVRLIVEGPWKRSYAELANESQFDSVELHRGVQEDLRFLLPIASKVRDLWINCELKSLDGIDSLVRLESLTVSSVLPASVDFAGLPNIHRVNLNGWNSKIAKSLFRHTGIRELRIEGFPEHDCTSFALLRQLEKLCLAKGRLHSLAGLSECSHLRSIELSHLRELTDVSEVKKLVALDALTLGESLPRLESIEEVLSCSQLSELTVIGIPSQIADTSWVRAFERATVLRLQCGVVNIDLSELLSARSLRQVVIVSASERELADTEITEVALAAGLPAPKVTRFGSKKRPAYMFDFAS